MKKSLNHNISLSFSRLASERGFNLIEVLVAMMLISMARFAVCSVLVFSSGTMHSVKKETAVTQALETLQQTLGSQQYALSAIAKKGSSAADAEPSSFMVSNSGCDSALKFKGAATTATESRDGLETTLQAWFSNIQKANPDAKISFSVNVAPTELRNMTGNALPGADAGKIWGPLAVDIVLVESANGTCREFSSGTPSDDELSDISDAIKTEALQGSVTEESGVDYQKSRIMIDYVEAAK